MPPSLRQSFIPELAIVSMTLLCVKMKINIGGITRITAVAALTPIRATPLAEICVSKVGRLLSCSE